MTYTRPPTLLQRCRAIPKSVIKSLYSKGTEWVHDQTAVFEKTPQEYSDDAWKNTRYSLKPVRLVRGSYPVVVREPERIRKNRKTLWVYRRKTKWAWQEETWVHRVELKDPPAPGTIRVKWLPELEPLEGNYGLYEDVPLGPNGELDLGILKRKWGMENCFPVDPVRLSVFYPNDPEKLSGMAVRLLMENQTYLRVIGMGSYISAVFSTLNRFLPEQPSERTVDSREFRKAWRELPLQVKEEVEDWAGFVLSLFMRWLGFLLLLGVLFAVTCAVKDTPAVVLGKKIAWEVLERDTLVRKMAWVTLKTWMKLPDITSWACMGRLGDVGGNVLVMQDGR